MSDLDWKNWVLVVVIAIGVMFEVLKHLPGSAPSPIFSKENFTFGGLQPFSIRKNLQPAKPSRVAQTHPIRIAGNSALLESKVKEFVAANAPQQTEFNHEKGAEGSGKVKKKKQKDEDGWEIYIDPISGKKYRRRKKKSVAKVDEVKQETPKPAAKPDTKDDDVAALTFQAVTTGALPPVKTQDKDGNLTLEEWVRRLLTYPDTKMTRLFIQQYQIGAVTSDVFYKITNMMVEDSRPEMKSLGVLCAGMTPSLASFQILAGVQKAENPGSTVSQSAGSFLDNYASLSNLSILQSAMSGTDTYSVYVAVQKLDKSVHTDLVKSTAATATSTATTTTVTANAPSYKPFLDLLPPLTKSRDVNLSEQAKATYATLQAALGPQTPTQTTTANDPTVADPSALAATATVP